MLYGGKRYVPLRVAAPAYSPENEEARLIVDRYGTEVRGDELPREYYDAIYEYSELEPEEIRAETWTIGEVPTEEFIRLYWQHSAPSLIRDLAESGVHDWESYHDWYVGKQSEGFLAKRPERWPVYLYTGPPDESFQLIWDGHHRFHTYVARGDATIPFYT